MREFWNTFTKSIYGPDFYHNLGAKPMKSSFAYFFFLITILGILATIPVSLRVIGPLKTFLNSASTQVLNVYPDDLQVTAKGGKISTNASGPTFFKMPAELKDTTPPRALRRSRILIISS